MRIDRRRGPLPTSSPALRQLFGELSQRRREAGPLPLTGSWAEPKAARGQRHLSLTGVRTSRQVTDEPCHRGRGRSPFTQRLTHSAAGDRRTQPKRREAEALITDRVRTLRQAIGELNYRGRGAEPLTQRFARSAAADRRTEPPGARDGGLLPSASRTLRQVIDEPSHQGRGAEPPSGVRGSPRGHCGPRRSCPKGSEQAGSWAILGLNQWPLPCQGSALPLS